MAALFRLFLTARVLAEDQIQRPAAAHVRPRRAQVREDGVVGEAGVFEGVGEDRQAVEGAIGVDAFGELWDDAIIPGSPRIVERENAEWVAEDAPSERSGLAVQPGGGCFSFRVLDE